MCAICDQVSFYVVTKCLSMCSEEEVVEVMEVLVPEEVSLPEVIEVPLPLPNDAQKWDSTILPGRK